VAEGLNKDSLWAGGDEDRPEEPHQPPPAPVEEKSAAQEEPAPRPKLSQLPSPPKADRFRFVLGALAGLAVAAVVAAVALVAGTQSGRDPGGWSAWKPSTDGDRGAEQIAAYVGQSYKGSNGDQLVAVKAGPLKVGEIDLSVARRGAGGKVEIVDGESISFTMCGLGPNCSIASGKPSVQRGLLLQREALELALYSFHYLPGVEHVVSFLPPRPGEKSSQGKAIFFSKDEVERALEVPITATLPSPPPRVDSLRANDIAMVEQFARRAVHCFSFRRGQDVSAFLVLDPPIATCEGGVG
jgi:hypothetical protein